MKKEQMPDDEAVWRFSIISPLIHRCNNYTLEEMLHFMSEKEYIRHDGKIIRLSPETIRKWLYAYRKSGLPGLRTKERNDKGSSIIDENLADKLQELRNNHPRWTIKLMLKELREKNIWNGTEPSLPTIYRYCKSHNLQRDPHLAEKIYRKFEYNKFGQLFMVDFMHFPRLFVGRKKKKAYLQVIIDDATRYIVSAKIHTSESVESIVYDFMYCIRKFGIPCILYSDNGSAYKSRHLKLVCARLGVDLVHTPVRKPMGRGKCERVFRTIRDQFVSRYNFISLDNANELLEKWVSEYHTTVHSSMDTTPLNKRMSVEDLCRKIPGVQNYESLFYMEKRSFIYSNGTIRLKKREYEIVGFNPKTRVTIYYMPWDLSRVYYGPDYQPAKLLDPLANANRFNNPVFQGGINESK